MKYLLDTHAFIWATSDPTNLSTQVKSILLDRHNEVLLSVVSVWEIQIKLQSGKLTLPAPIKTIVEAYQQFNQISILSIELRHTLILSQMPNYHKDPFDRILIAQTQVE